MGHVQRIRGQLLAQCESALVQGLRGLQVTLIQGSVAQVAENSGSAGRMGREFLIDDQRALQELPGRREIAQISDDRSQVTQAVGDVERAGSERLLDREAPLEQLLRGG